MLNPIFDQPQRDSVARVWPTWPFVTALVVLFLGPVIAPLFQATRLPLAADSGALARDLLATYICPTPAKSYVLLGHPMAVCARCWGATIGLWLAFGWTMYDGRLRSGQTYQSASSSIRGLRPIVGRLLSFVYWLMRLSWPVHLALAALPFALWVLEIRFWPTAPLGVLLLNGALAGFGAGLFFCSVWPGLVSPRASTARSRA